MLIVLKFIYKTNKLWKPLKDPDDVRTDLQKSKFSINECVSWHGHKDLLIYDLLSISAINWAVDKINLNSYSKALNEYNVKF